MRDPMFDVLCIFLVAFTVAVMLALVLHTGQPTPKRPGAKGRRDDANPKLLVDADYSELEARAAALYGSLAPKQRVCTRCGHPRQFTHDDDMVPKARCSSPGCIGHVWQSL